MRKEYEQEWFKIFWKVFQKVILEAESYNRNTVIKLMEYITLTRKEEEEKYPSRKVRVKNCEKIKEKSEGLLDTVIISIRYRNKPDYMKMGIKSIIKVISEHYMFDEEDNLLIDNKVEENLLGNRELLTYGYIIEDDEVDIRFLRFEEWLEESELTTIKDKKYINMRYFKEILHLEENIIKEENRDKVREFQKKIDYQWRKLFETKEFNKEYDNIEELVSSNEEDDVSENISEEDENFEMIIRNYWLKNGYEIDIEGIRRIINFRVEYEIIKTKEFMSFYKTIEELNDKGIKEELKIWHYMYTIECPICNKMMLRTEAIEYNVEFFEKICKSCYEKELKNKNELNDETETEKRLERLKNLIKVLEIEVSDRELLRLISMEYRNVDILSTDFIKLFQEYKNESEKEIKRILDEYLKKFEIEESEEEVEEENDNTDDSEKIGEILDPEEHEIWEENIKDFNENKFENYNENVINTEGFGLSQNSDSNNSLNIKDSDIENSDTERNINATRGLVVEFPLFGGSENEDAGEWVQRFTDAYTTNALADDNVNRFRIAKGCLVGTARDWLRTEGANIDNWGGGNNDTSLDRRVVSKYASDEIKERWQDELENIKQGDRESVTGYVTRFRSMVKKAEGDAAVPVGSQKRIFMKGLSLEYIRGVYTTRPANLNEAITAARNQETGIKAVVARFSGKEIVEEKNIEEIMKEETNKYKKENEIYQKMQKPVNEKDINDMSKMLEQFKAEILNGIERNQPRGNVNRNTNTRNARIIRCFECNEEGHIRLELQTSRVNPGQLASRVKSSRFRVSDFPIT
ncbi:unnamed protein product [Rhizophagus irregularis]|nr:unnamed protein product [Rhizophagus irregularis]